MVDQRSSIVDRDRPTANDDRRSVVVIGGASIDIVATPAGTLQPHVSNPGRIRISAGGTGRNVAENLARLGISTHLIAAVGAHPMAELLLEHTARAGVDLTGIVRTAERGDCYAAIRSPGAIEWASSDMSAAEALTPGDMERAAGMIRSADFVVIDANLLPATIERAAALAGGRRICLLPVSPAKASRLGNVLPFAALIVLGVPEAEVLTDMTVREPAHALRAAGRLRALGVGTVVITMAEAGIGWVTATPIWSPATAARVVDPSGAGDAVAAVAIYSLLAGMDTETASRLASAAGAMTVGVEGATHPGLSLKALHAHGSMV